jgi:hypothetical protein
MTDPLVLTFTNIRYARMATPAAIVTPVLIAIAKARDAAKRTAALPMTMEAVTVKKTRVKKRMMDPLNKHQPMKETSGKMESRRRVVAKSWTVRISFPPFRTKGRDRQWSKDSCLLSVRMRSSLDATPVSRLYQ